MSNKLFSMILLLLFILGIGIFVMPQNTSSLIENRSLKTNDDVEVTDLSHSTEEVMKDQFYQRDLINKAYKKVELLFNKPFSKVYVNGVIMNYLDKDVIDIGDGYIINSLIDYDDEDLDSASSRGYNVNELDLRYSDIKTYVYFPTRIEELLYEDCAGVSKLQDVFLFQLNQNIKTDYLKVSGIEEHKEYFYKSDMHWNVRGAYEGYKDIINLIGEDFDLGDIKEPVGEVCYPYEFKGNVTSQIAGNSEPDYIRDYYFDLGDFRYYANGLETDFNEVKNRYAETGDTESYSAYDYYFGNNYYMREFDFNQADKPNLLIFSDSYINTNMSWIASHFNKTVIIDLRSKPEDFDLDEIVSGNDIDIMLVSMRYSNLYFNGHMYIPLKQAD